MHLNTRLHSGFPPPLRSSWNLLGQPSPWATVAWVLRALFVCSRLFWFSLFLAFLFFFQIMASPGAGSWRHTVLVVCEQVFHRTASASQAADTPDPKKSVGLPSKPQNSLDQKLFHLIEHTPPIISLLLNNHLYFSLTSGGGGTGGRSCLFCAILHLFNLYTGHLYFNVLACPLTPENATVRKRVFIIWF